MWALWDIKDFSKASFCTQNPNNWLRKITLKCSLTWPEKKKHCQVAIEPSSPLHIINYNNYVNPAHGRWLTTDFSQTKECDTSNRSFPRLSVRLNKCDVTFKRRGGGGYLTGHSSPCCIIPWAGGGHGREGYLILCIPRACESLLDRQSAIPSFLLRDSAVLWDVFGQAASSQ